MEPTIFDWIGLIIIGLAPLAYCIIVFRWFINYSAKFSASKGITVICVLSGVSFLSFQIVQGILVLGLNFVSMRLVEGFSDVVLFDILDEIYRLVLDDGLSRSWIGVTHALFPGSFIDEWNYQYLWHIELIYIIFYAIIGAAIVVGAKLWTRDTLIKFIGLFVLIICFVVYTFGVYFWMATAMYL